MIYNVETVEEGEEEVVLKVSKKDWNYMLKTWMKSKENRCTSYGHFCGVMEMFYINDFEEVGEIDILDDNVDYNEELDDQNLYKKVKLLKVTDFEKYCDMEHG